MQLSVVIPAYNEASAIRAGKLARVQTWLAERPFETELLVVDDGSLDETLKLAQAVTARAMSIAHAGKAAAIVAGLRQALGEVVLLTDMDQATPITEAPKLLDAIGQGAHLAIGSRGLSRIGAPLGRYFLSWGQMALRGLLLGLKITDTQCGFKAMKRAAALEVLEHLQIYRPSRLSAIQGPSVTSGFDVELLFVAHRLGYQIREVPVAWSYQESRRVNLTRDAWRGIRDLASILGADWKRQYPT